MATDLPFCVEYWSEIGGWRLGVPLSVGRKAAKVLDAFDLRVVSQPAQLVRSWRSPVGAKPMTPRRIARFLRERERQSRRYDLRYSRNAVRAALTRIKAVV